MAGEEMRLTGMHSRLFGLFLVAGLYAAASAVGMLLFGVGCFAVVAVLGLPIVLLTLADHLGTERQIRREGSGQVYGFEVTPARRDLPKE
jgi:Flp pilus assembly protein TadB